MKRESLYTYYWIGVNIAPLNLLTEDVTLGTLAYRKIDSALAILRNLDTAKEAPPEFEESQRTARTLLRALERFFPPDPTEFAKVDYDRTLTKSESGFLLQLTAEFDLAFKTELSKLQIYHVDDVGLLNATTLMSHGERMFSPDVLSLFPKELVDELREAGKSIAVEIPTGAAFFLFRAVEVCIVECLRVFAFDKFKAMKESQRNWGQYTDMLEVAGVDPRVIERLTTLRKQRNPLIHPEDRVAPEELQTILADCMQAVHFMASVLAKHHKKFPGLALLLP